MICTYTLLLSFLAATGDPTLLERTEWIVLDGSQISGLQSVVSSVWPGATPAGIRYIPCARTVVDDLPRMKCEVRELRVGTVDGFMADDAAGRVKQKPQSRVGDVVTYMRSTKWRVLDPDEAIAVVSWIKLVWPWARMSKVQELRVRRVKLPGQPAFVEAQLVRISSLPDVDYIDAWIAGNRAKRIGTEP